MSSADEDANSAGGVGGGAGTTNDIDGNGAKQDAHERQRVINFFPTTNYGKLVELEKAAEGGGARGARGSKGGVVLITVPEAAAHQIFGIRGYDSSKPRERQAPLNGVTIASIESTSKVNGCFIPLAVSFPALGKGNHYDAGTGQRFGFVLPPNSHDIVSEHLVRPANQADDTFKQDFPGYNANNVATKGVTVVHNRVLVAAEHPVMEVLKINREHGTAATQDALAEILHDTNALRLTDDGPVLHNVPKDVFETAVRSVRDRIGAQAAPLNLSKGISMVVSRADGKRFADSSIFQGMARDEILKAVATPFCVGASLRVAMNVAPASSSASF